MSCDAIRVRETGLDQFYTVPSVAKRCLDLVGMYYDWESWGLVVEPSAGNGSFLTQIPASNRVGLDIAPQHPDILCQNFFTYTPPSTTEPILVVGNPPFGRVSSVAIRFFNHASRWTSVIAFIVPRTFRRVSVQNKLSLYFHLVHDEELSLDPCCFEPPMLAKCCFQIWEKREMRRPFIHLATTHPDWEFLGFGPKDERSQPTPPMEADFAIRAYGGRCGEIVQTGLEQLRPKSWHWIRCNGRVDQQTLIQRFQVLNYGASENTARQNSIGRGELVRLYERYMGQSHPISDLEADAEDSSESGDV